MLPFMFNLLLRTWSQTLQAFLPVVVTLVWLRSERVNAGAKAARLGLISGVVLTPLAGLWFQQVERQSQLEAGLAWIATGTALIALLAIRRRTSAPARQIAWTGRVGLTLAAIVLILRQT